MVRRTALVRRLEGRFSHRLTTVTGGAGSGKTTLLGQAMEDATGGRDVWLPISDRAGGPDLLERALAVLHPDRDAAGATLETLREAIIGLVPEHVCLVVDDVHLLADRVEVVAIMGALPTNGHLLLSGRTVPDVGQAGLDGRGQLLEIDQDALLFTDDEQVEFANLRGVDHDVLDQAGGWPAFVEFAARGFDARAHRFIAAESIGDLDEAHLADLAAFWWVGGGDDAVAWAVTGRSLDDLAGGLPLVRWSDGAAVPHDLWGELTGDRLDDSTRTRAALAAARTHRERGEFDRAVDLASRAGDPVETLAAIADAVRRGVDGRLRADQLARWLGLVPSSHRASPIVRLVEGIIAREDDGTSEAARTSLNAAAEAFRAGGDAELELTALLECGYAARIRGDLLELDDIRARLRELSSEHAPARPFVGIVDAWTAIVRGDAETELVAIQQVDRTSLPEPWRVTRDHLEAHALQAVGRASEGLAVVPPAEALRSAAIPGALVTESQCQWFAGRPELAIRRSQRAGPTAHGSRDRFVESAWVACMHGYTGDVVRMARHRELVTDVLGDQPSPVMLAQLAGLDAIAALTSGDPDKAATLFRRILAVAPLERPGLAFHVLRAHLLMIYALVPETRDVWEDAPLQGTQAEIRDLARALVAARETANVRTLAARPWPEPGVVAAHAPLPLAAELAAWGILAGLGDGRRLAAWLIEHWSGGARSCFEALTEHDRLREPVEEILRTTPVPVDEDVELAVLGPVEIRRSGRAVVDPDARRERVRALLTWLVLNPVTTRQAIAGALWPDLAEASAARNVRTTLNYLHGVLEPRRAPGAPAWFVRLDGQTVRLHSSAEVDLWRFRERCDAAAEAERTGKPSETLSHLLDAVGRWRGPLAADLDHTWLDLERIHIQSRFVAAATRAAEILTVTDRAVEAVEIARRAVQAEPWDPRASAALATAYEHAGDRSAAEAVRARTISA